MGDRGHNRHGPKRGVGLLCPFRGELGPRLIQRGLRRGLGLLPYKAASSSIQPVGHHNRHEPKTGCVPFLGRAATPSNTSPRPRFTFVPSNILIIQPFGHIYMGQKLDGVGVPFLWGIAGSPSNTKSPGPRPTSTQVAF